MAEKLYLNTLTFEYPKEPVKFYFSETDDAERRSTRIKSHVLVPAEIKKNQKYIDLFAGVGGFEMFTSFDLPTIGFDEIEIDFHNPENEYLVKRYYNRRLEKYFRHYDDVVTTTDGITHGLQVWLLTHGTNCYVNYKGKRYGLMEMDRFTLRVKYDHFNRCPYLLVANDRPALLLNAPLADLFNDDAEDDPFSGQSGITPSMINKVMTREERLNAEGNKYVVRKIDRYEYLQSHNSYCPPESTRPFMSGEMKRYFGLDKQDESSTHDSKYVKYMQKIESFRSRFLDTEAIQKIFPKLARHFTEVNPLQIGQASSSKRMLVFGQDMNGQYFKNSRQQAGVNFGPRVRCRFTDIQLIAIYHESDKEYASKLLGYFKNGNYADNNEEGRKQLSKYIGSTVSYAAGLHIEFKDRENPVKEIETALNGASYINRNQKVKYVGIYVSPIHKYASAAASKECYYKIKELFLRYKIPTQCIDSDRMKGQIKKDNEKKRKDFIYTLQNMGVAICAKLGGAPWLLDETDKKEMIIGIGAFRSDDRQYIGAAFSFDNTGIFNSYNYFQKNELDELVGAIKFAIMQYSSVNNRPDRIIIHYYKKISRKNEFRKVEDMLHSLNLDVPVYIVTINKTESEDFVMFDSESNYEDYDFQARQRVEKPSYMPYSGKWINLGQTKDGHSYLLCNNTRYEGAKFSKMDGFPFPVKLTIACPNRNDQIDTPVVQQLIDQVYQFSRIYWKSVKQQGLPVTIKYPEMIAEIMPHFSDKTVYAENNCLWFL